MVRRSAALVLSSCAASPPDSTERNETGAWRRLPYRSYEFDLLFEAMHGDLRASLGAPQHPTRPKRSEKIKGEEMNPKRMAFVFGALFLSAAFAAPAAAATIVFEQPLQSEDLTAA